MKLVVQCMSGGALTTVYLPHTVTSWGPALLRVLAGAAGVPAATEVWIRYGDDGTDVQEVKIKEGLTGWDSIVMASRKNRVVLVKPEDAPRQAAVARQQLQAPPIPPAKDLLVLVVKTEGIKLEVKYAGHCVRTNLDYFKRIKKKQWCVLVQLTANNAERYPVPLLAEEGDGSTMKGNGKHEALLVKCGDEDCIVDGTYLPCGDTTTIDAVPLRTYLRLFSALYKDAVLIAFSIHYGPSEVLHQWYNTRTNSVHDSA